jgi:hypothetical protein
VSRVCLSRVCLSRVCRCIKFFSAIIYIFYIFSGYTGYVNTQAREPVEDYGFAGMSNGYANGPTSLPNAPTAGKPTANGYADMSGGGKRTPDNLEDKWYLKDSMRPVGAASHGVHCKCYRCQRKLTAI